MILYHFTNLWNLLNSGPDSIKAAGLLPRSTLRDWDFIFPNHLTWSG
jgi:hypothetical protein